MDDSVDRAIVAEIARDGRATLSQLSDAVGLSVSAVQSRLRRLETRGVITGYRAILDPELVGTPLSAFIEITPLDLKEENFHTARAIESLVARLQEE